MTIVRLPETTLTLYAELLDQCIQAEAEERATPGGGSFVSKTIKGAKYWYLQRSQGPGKQQDYLGRESRALLAWMRNTTTQRTSRVADEKRRRELVGMLAAGGAVRESAAVSQVLKTLANAGVFRLGGVLIGTHAFASYANLLGVRFDQQSIRTGDVDLAHDVAISLALSQDEPRVELLQQLRTIEPRFVEVPGFDPREPSTSFKARGRDLRVDFLTAAHSRQRNAPVFLPHLGVAAQPLPAIDYILDSPIPAAIVGGSGVLVNVPQPARFAVHKLWVMRQRPASEQAKARKDLRQAEQLLELLLADRPDDVEAAWTAAMARSTLSRTLRGAIRALSFDVREKLSGVV